MQYADVAKTIDHALLLPTLEERDLDSGLALCRNYDVASVCILPHAVERARQALAGSDVKVSTTVGFPHGAVGAAVKRFEAERAVAAGAQELDMVVNIGWVLSGRWGAVAEDVAGVPEVCRGGGALLKLIFENCYLTDAHRTELCRVAGEVGVDWVKTSTGFGSGGATLADVQLMRRESPRTVAVKASGGIRDLSTLLGFLPYVTRIGTSHTSAILDEHRANLGLPAIAPAAASGQPGGY